MVVVVEQAAQRGGPSVAVDEDPFGGNHGGLLLASVPEVDLQVVEAFLVGENPVLLILCLVSVGVGGEQVESV